MTGTRRELQLPARTLETQALGLLVVVLKTMLTWATPMAMRMKGLILEPVEEIVRAASMYGLPRSRQALIMRAVVELLVILLASVLNHASRVVNASTVVNQGMNSSPLP